MHERRSVPRFKIPGARVKLHQEGGFQGCEAQSDEGLLDDCSVNGLRIETQKAFKPGAKAKLELFIPEHENLHLTGNIIWAAPALDKTKMHVVVEFSPFGEGIGYNPVAARKHLEEIAEEYLLNAQ